MAYEEAMFGPGTPERYALDAGEAQLKADDGEIQLMAGAVLANNPENYQAATNVKNLSGWKQYGYATGLAQMAGGTISHGWRTPCGLITPPSSHQW